jgi:hypothetical protein
MASIRCAVMLRPLLHTVGHEETEGAKKINGTSRSQHHGNRVFRNVVHHIFYAMQGEVGGVQGRI